MKVRTLLAGCVMASAMLMACDKEDDPKVNESDRVFLNQVANSNLSEIELGQMASTKGLLDSVKIFGQLMVTEHTMAQHELDSLAQAKNVGLPYAPDQQQQNLKAQLNGYTGKQFDTVYMNSQVAAHQATVQLLQTMINSASDQDVRGYASKYLPHVQKHLVMADSVARKSKRQ